jgi:hypothetical protein
MNVPLLDPVQRWECPLCDTQAVTREAQPHTRFHTCPGLAGLNAPMVPAGTRCKVEAHEREDYIGDEHVQYDGEGRPVMNVEITRDDGTDLAIYAPCATATIRGN